MNAEWSVRIARALYSLLFACAALLCSATAHSQQSVLQGISDTPSTLPMTPVADYRDPEDTALKVPTERMTRIQAKERQKRIAADADQLLVLTAQYRKRVEARTAATPEGQRVLATIEAQSRHLRQLSRR